MIATPKENDNIKIDLERVRRERPCEREIDREIKECQKERLTRVFARE